MNIKGTKIKTKYRTFRSIREFAETLSISRYKVTLMLNNGYSPDHITKMYGNPVDHQFHIARLSIKKTLT